MAELKGGTLMDVDAGGLGLAIAVGEA